jgi:hypothetical protein
MSEQMAASRLFVARPLVAALVLAGTSAVWAQSGESGPYYIGASQGFTRQQNIFGSTDGSGSRIDDTYSSTGIFGGVNLQLGRQNLYANGVVRANRYQDVKLLDNNSTGLNGGLNWETIGNLSGTLRVAANRSLANYSSPDSPDLTNVRNIETSHDLSATVNKGITSRLSATGGLQRRKVDYSAESYYAAEFSDRSGNIGLRYGRSDQILFGIGYRKTKTDRNRARQTSPGIYASDKADRDDIDFTVAWAPSALSTVNARLSYGREDHSLAALSDFKGTTGELGWTYRPSGRTTMIATFARDTGTSSSFSNYEGTGQPLEVYTSRLTNVLSTSLAYELTNKIRLNGSLRYSKGKVSEVTGPTAGDDEVRAARLGATYAFSRGISFSCNASQENRDTGSDNIKTRSIGCSGGITFR